MDELNDPNLSVNWQSNDNYNNYNSSGSLNNNLYNTSSIIENKHVKSNKDVDMKNKNIFNNNNNNYFSPLPLQSLFVPPNVNDFKFTFSPPKNSSNSLLKSPQKNLFHFDTPSKSHIDALVDELDIADNSSSIQNNNSNNDNHSPIFEQVKKRQKLSNNSTSINSTTYNGKRFNNNSSSVLINKSRDYLKESNHFMDLIRFDNSNNSSQNFKTSTPLNNHNHYDDFHLLQKTNHFNFDLFPKSKSYDDIPLSNQLQLKDLSHDNYNYDYNYDDSINNSIQKLNPPQTLTNIPPQDFKIERFGNMLFDWNNQRWIKVDVDSSDESDEDLNIFDDIESLGDEPIIKHHTQPRSALKSSNNSLTPARSVSFKQPSPKSLNRSSRSNLNALRDVFNSPKYQKSPTSTEFFKQSSNQNSEISSSFQRTLQKLSISDESDNDQKVSKKITTCLNLNDRHIKSLKNLSSSNFLHIQYLNLSNNNIKSLKPLHSLLHIRQLNLNNNDLHSLEGLDNIYGIQKLSASNNILRGLDFSDYDWQYIEYLDISQNDLIGIRGIEALKNLSFFNLDCNNLTQLEFPITFNKLKVLRISHNNLSHFNAEHMPNVRTLFADNNRVNWISGVRNLRKLENLSFREQKGDYL